MAVRLDYRRTEYGYFSPTFFAHDFALCLILGFALNFGLILALGFMLTFFAFAFAFAFGLGLGLGLGSALVFAFDFLRETGSALESTFGFSVSASAAK
jgi:hypothetical protein